MSGDQEAKSKTLLNLAKTRRILLQEELLFNPERNPILQQLDAEMDALAKEIAQDGEQRRNPMMELDPRDLAMIQAFREIE